MIERNTKQQSDSKEWYENREWRITASNFGSICKATEKRDVQKMAEYMLNPPKLSCKSVVHGKTYEKVAKSKFEELIGLKIEPCGVFVNHEFPFLAATPDGLVGKTEIVEIKCPFKGKDSAIEPGILFPFLIYDEENKITLKETHSYMYQIQGQLGISKKNCCIFIVYTHKELFYQRIYFNREMFENQILPKTTEFYEQVFKPFIASKL